MLFPELKNKSFVVLNLDAEARKWCTENDIVVTAKNNPLNDPTICQKMVDAVHQKSSKDFSYGGWMEDRSFLWKGSYLENEQKFIHLGVDFNVPVGTKVAADFGAEVVRIDSDYPEQGGWGTRIIVRHDSLPICMIYAHLDPSVMCKVGDILKPGDIFAKVGLRIVICRLLALITLMNWLRIMPGAHWTVMDLLKI